MCLVSGLWGLDQYDEEARFFYFIFFTFLHVFDEIGDKITNICLIFNFQK